MIEGKANKREAEWKGMGILGPQVSLVINTLLHFTFMS